MVLILVKRDQDELDKEREIVLLLQNHIHGSSPLPGMQWKSSAARVPQCYRNWQGAAALSDGNLLMNEDFDEKIHERLQ
ncbi:unnamed protein product [Boreogadus saida]